VTKRVSEDDVGEGGPERKGDSLQGSYLEKGDQLARDTKTTVNFIKKRGKKTRKHMRG